IRYGLRLPSFERGLAAERTRQKLRDVAERTLHSDCDVLLPTHAHGEPLLELAILASTDANGAGALVSRLRASIRRTDELGDLDSLASIWVGELDLDDVHELPLPQALEAVVKRIDALTSAEAG